MEGPAPQPPHEAQLHSLDWLKGAVRILKCAVGSSASSLRWNKHEIIASDSIDVCTFLTDYLSSVFPLFERWKHMGFFVGALACPIYRLSLLSGFSFAIFAWVLKYNRNK